MRQSASQRKSKIELTCRRSTDKLTVSTSKENIAVTPPRPKHIQTLSAVQEDLATGCSTKKTRRKISNLQIDIECIEDEYSKKTTAVKPPAHEGTPLFASVSTNPVNEVKRLQVEMHPVLHESVVWADSQTRSRVLTEESTIRVDIRGGSEKYSYDNLIEAIKIHHRQESEQLTVDRR